MPTTPAAPGPFQGFPAALASHPLDPAVRGGLNGSHSGITDGPALRAVHDQLGPLGNAPAQAQDPFQGAGPLLESDDQTVFQTIDGLVQRQETLALSRLAQDTHWTYVKLGYPWSTLEKDPNRSLYRQSLPYGSAGVTIQAVPNKAWDLVNKTTEALLVDFPRVECEPGDASEEAEAAADLATRFLTLDASEQGTNDEPLFWDRVQRSMTCASSYLECWTDPTGGGYVPLQIPAHPEAQSPQQPMLGPDGMPTTSPVMRYVTQVGPDGQPTEESQFTDDPRQAAPQWQPKLRASKWQREHLRVYPETATVDQAQKVIILGYCTLDEAKRRWPLIAQMAPEDLTKLCDWQPSRYVVLLPPFLRGRWALTDGRDKNKQGSSDERIMFYYHLFAKASPDHPKGADLVVTGALGKKVLDKQLLSAEVQAHHGSADTPDQGPEPKQETRCLEIPVVQVTPRGDPDDQDPSGRAYIEMVAGAIESNAHLAMSASEVIDKNLHLEGYASSVTPITGAMREDARATGDILRVIRPEDKPVWGQPIPFETAFFNFYELSDQAINSIGSAERAAKGQDNAGERSGKAIALATANNNVSLGGMNQAVNTAYTRWCRIKLERMMTTFTTEQQIAYVGEDGIFKADAFDAMDFALVGKITVKAGTGGLITPDQKIQNVMGLQQAQILTHEEAADAIRPAVSQKLGLPASPAEQRIERQISAFKKGPPHTSPATPGTDWVTQWRAYQQQKQAYEDMQANAQQAQGMAPSGPKVPGAPTPAVPVALKPPVSPWTPWTPMPTDELPLIAQMRARKLAHLIDEAKFESWPGEWQQTAFDEFARMQQVIAAAQPVPPLPKGVVIQGKAGDAETLAAEEQAALHPQHPPQPAPQPAPKPVPQQPAAPAGAA